MINFVLGYKASGKSLFAERSLLLNGKSTLYIGTLPDYAYYRETIEIHKRRRPEEWGLIELTHDPVYDMEVINSQIDLYDNILLDGLTFYVIRCIYFAQDLDPCKSLFVDLLQRMQRDKVCSYLVDTPVPVKLDSEARRMVFSMHYLIMRHAAAIFYVDNGKTRNMSFNEAYRFDKVQLCK
ncbi:MAG TPA: bifunctional adenosylcobinamide kinase/adenosylcobinamide-phosphate guanylyltransferase [Clostridia bacterium]|nr:bifunctional adenosylcobinamide kinase/adenosylcobinamide-phosphate guanylyltransferase [Clostridia bacterium]